MKMQEQNPQKAWIKFQKFTIGSCSGGLTTSHNIVPLSKNSSRKQQPNRALNLYLG